jgi:hypothetical protein
LIIDIVTVEVEVTTVRQHCAERRQCWDDQPDRGLHYHERRSARLIPDAVSEAVRQSRVAHGRGPLRNLTHYRAAVGIIVIVPLARIVMRVIRLELFLGGRALLDLLPIRQCGTETRCDNSGGR